MAADMAHEGQTASPAPGTASGQAPSQTIAAVPASTTRTAPAQQPPASGDAPAPKKLVKRKTTTGSTSTSKATGTTTKKTATGKTLKRPSSKAPPPPPPPPKKSLIKGPGLLAVCAAASGLLIWQIVRFFRKRSSQGGNTSQTPKAPCAGVKPSAKCVALADGSACVVRRQIPADNSCLFNSIAYCMHGSKQKAEFLRGVVAREVSSDPETYSAAFLGMPNMAYCNWIVQPHNWGGGIELAILARHYGREIGAWNIESGKQHVFGEDAAYPKACMVIYTGTHYDALAIAKNPRAPESEDKTEFNPRTKTGKMAIAAAQKLVQLSYKGPKKGAPSKQEKGQPRLPPKAAAQANGKAAGGTLKCEECGVVCAGSSEAAKHAAATKHTRFSQVASS